MKLHAHFKVIIGIVATLNIVAKAQPTPPAQANKDVGLLNGGSILRDGKYIQGSVPESWGLLMDKLAKHVNKNGVGYAKAMKELLAETDYALKTNDYTTLRALYKIFGDIFKDELRFTSDKPTHDAVDVAVHGNREEEARLDKGQNQLADIDAFFIKVGNALYNAMKDKSADKPN